MPKLRDILIDVDPLVYQYFSHRKEPPVSDLNQTILALQVMNGLKFYEVSLYHPANTSTKRFAVKADFAAEPGDSLIIASATFFAAARVHSIVEDFSYDEAVNWPWALSKIENPAALYAAKLEIGRAAERKLAQAKALQAAKTLLEQSGMKLEDLQLLLPKAAE